MTNDELMAKLEDIGRKIEQTKDKLRLHGIFSKDHQFTQEELDARYKLLKNQLEKEVGSLEGYRHHVGRLERAFLNWVNSIDFDSQ